MYLTVHGLAALVVAQAAPNPLVAFLLGLLSHLVLDFIPHGDEHLTTGFTRTRVVKRMLGATAIDGSILVFLLLIYLIATPSLSSGQLLAGLAGGLLPDLLEGVYLISNANWLKAYSRWHMAMHNWLRHRLLWTEGILVQVLVLAALWLTLI